MMALKNWALAAALAAGLMAGGASARAQVNAAEPDPSVWLRQVYDLYHRTQNSTDVNKQPSFELVVKRASKSLAALFKKNSDCEALGKGVCAIDWDFVIDGQDFKLSNIKVGALVAAGDKASVTVTFKNLGASCVNVYSFVREDGQWKVEDILTKSGSDKPVAIAKMLKDYDYSQ
jgi:Protein of unknown function (DUF3828)